MVKMPSAVAEFLSGKGFAVVGIVPCKVTAENGSIKRGDLLVTSTVPGHAMKGTDPSRMLGSSARETADQSPLRPSLHVARFRRPVSVQPCAIAPLGVQLDPIRRIRDHQDRLALAEEPTDIFRPGGVAAEYPMLSTNPQVADSGHRVFGERRCSVSPLLVWNCPAAHRSRWGRIRSG